MSEAESVLTFWFGDLDADGRADAATKKRWWKKDPAFDASIRAQFATVYDAIVAGERQDWLATPRGRLAYVIVLDQFSRNMFRDSAKMYAADDRAQRVVLEGIEQGVDRQLRLAERVFFYMPLMHSEDVALQDRCVELFSACVDELEGALAEDVGANLEYAIQHRDIVAQWGRFPHRNVLVGRKSTAEEIAFLEQPGSSF